MPRSRSHCGSVLLLGNVEAVDFSLVSMFVVVLVIATGSLPKQRVSAPLPCPQSGWSKHAMSHFGGSFENKHALG